MPDPIISVRNVSKTYSDGQVRALDHISVDIAPGEFACIVGPSGCGKSTLLNLMGGLDAPSDGEIFVEGRRLESRGNLDHYRSQSIGFVFQSFYLLPNLTALENVQIPMMVTSATQKQQQERATFLLEMVGLTDRKHHVPHQLSIGQRQRVAIARALANAPKIVLADEPTGNLDTRNGQEVLELLIRLRQEQQTTLIIITHDPAIAQRADRVIELLDGRLKPSLSVASKE
ncbi:MAG: ABC transporter ATP-binding protein [Pirellulales bacterium]